jgi:hypothetical protein
MKSQFFLKFSSIRFHGNPYSDFQAASCVQIAGLSGHNKDCVVADMLKMGTWLIHKQDNQEYAVLPNLRAVTAIENNSDELKNNRFSKEAYENFFFISQFIIHNLQILQ